MKSLEQITNIDNLDIIECSFAVVDSSWHNFVAFFPYYRIYLITDGEAELILKNSTIHLKAHHWYLIPPFQVVTSKCNVFMSHYYLHFKPRNNSSTFLDFYRPIGELLASPEDEVLYSALIDSFNENDIGSLIKTNALFQYFLSRFFVKSECYNPNILRFSPVISYINNHINESIKLSSLSSILNLDDVYFSNLFKKTFGVSPIQFVHDKKMNVAAVRIIEEDSTIKEVALSLGFENEIYFFRLFKQTFGITPKQYKEEFKQNLRSFKP